MYSLLRFVPKNYLSHFLGQVAYIRLPKHLNEWVIRRFCKVYGVCLDEVELPVASYPSLGDFFIRRLKPGVRPIGEGLVSPVDGYLSESGTITQGRLIQAKGREYSAAALLADSEWAERFEGGVYLTFYLAPGDYHHIHAPISGSIVQATLIEGKLWPVNSWSVGHIPELFCRNERIVTTMTTKDYGTIAVVKVGATNVGSVSLSYHALCANTNPSVFRARKGVVRQEILPPVWVDKGDLIGSFRLGSTVIVLIGPGHFAPGTRFVRGRLKMGESLCR